jgi:hypothetical protein
MRADPPRAARVHTSNITLSSKTCKRALLLLAATLLVSVAPNCAVIHLITLLFQRFESLSTMTTTTPLLYATVDRRNIPVHDVHLVDAAATCRNHKQPATATSAVFAASLEYMLSISGYISTPCPSPSCTVRNAGLIVQVV